MIPTILIIGQVIYLAVQYQKLNVFYYNWIICDLVLNSFGTVAYLIQLERIDFEQKEASENFVRILDKDMLAKPAAKAPKKLKISEDYYSMSFCAMMKHYRKKASITHEQKARYFVNVMFIFGMQSILLLLAYYDMT